MGCGSACAIGVIVIGVTEQAHLSKRIKHAELEQLQEEAVHAHHLHEPRQGVETLHAHDTV